MKAAVVTLGCAKNQVDSEVMLGVLKAEGFSLTSKTEEAELIVVNTCAFLQEAVNEGIDRILEVAEFKKKGSCKRLIVAGCMVERYRAKLAESLPEVDRFISTDELLSVARDGGTTLACFDPQRKPSFLYDHSIARLSAAGPGTAYVKIAEGCDRVCSFCIIPKLRGGYRSRDMQSISQEISGLLQSGIHEINLLAQDSTNYGRESRNSEAKDICNLLKVILEDVTAFDCWIRLLYAYPTGVTRELLEIIAGEKKICSYLDLPLQHISKNMLERMHRPLGEKKTRGLIETIRKDFPEIVLRTSFLVGFPGETEEDFRQLENFVEEGYFSHLGVFVYSDEEEAASFEMEPKVADELKEERRERIMLAQQKNVAELNSRLIGQQIKVLVEDWHPETNLLIAARSEYQAPETDGQIIINEFGENYDQNSSNDVLFKLRGKFAEVEITDIAGYDLLARLLSEVKEGGL